MDKFSKIAQSMSNMRAKARFESGIKNGKRALLDVKSEWAQAIARNQLRRRFQECIRLQKQHEKARLARSRDDAIVRAYHAEGGIFDMLQEFVDFVDFHLEELDQTEMIYQIACKGKLDVAVFQWKKLNTELQNLDERAVALEGSDDVEMGNFEKQLGWVNITERTSALEKDLHAIERERLSSGDYAELNKRLSLFFNRLEEAKNEADDNMKRLVNMEAALGGTRISSEPVNGELYEALRTSLIPEEYTPREGQSADDYKAMLTGVSERLVGQILTPWPKANES